MSSYRVRRLTEFDRGAQESLGPSRFCAGVDEVGRGPLAGPVVAAAVLFFRKFKLPGLNDSKLVAPALREKLFREIPKYGLIGIGVVSEAEIDEINIYQASRLAMKRAVLALTRTPDLLMIDGNTRLDLPLPQKTIVQGDRKSACIAAASIIAKVYRDAWMHYLDQLYPAYAFKDHKGYATPEHLEKLRGAGPSPVHRKSFLPVRRLCENMPAL